MLTKFLPKWNIETSYFDVASPQQAKELIQPNTKIIYAETPTNPGVDVLDLRYLGDLAQKHNLILVIDNCFATPYLQQPIKFGADLVIHSATKLIDYRHLMPGYCQKVWKRYQCVLIVTVSLL